MQKIDFGFGDLLLKTIASAISDAVGQDFNDAKKQLGTYTSNSNAGLLWDLINTNIKRKLEQIQIEAECTKTKRGIWEFITLYDLPSFKIISIMKDNRLQEILRHPARYRKHYTAALADMFNHKLEEHVKQKKLLKMPVQKEILEELKKTSFEICSNFGLQDSEHLYVILGFSSSSGKLTGLKAYFVTPQLELAEEISLSQYIPRDYNMPDEDTTNEENEEKEEIKISLTAEAIKRKENNEQQKVDLEIKKDTDKKELKDDIKDK